jgi:hypothetical protein
VSAEAGQQQTNLDLLSRAALSGLLPGLGTALTISTMASSSSEPELRSEQEIIGRFQEMRRQMTALVSNLQTLEAGRKN